MSLLGMPLLIMNMGGEMLYILEQRLLAQSISREKSKRVLQDVVRMMFNTKFIEELFKPQELYTNTSIRGIFDRLAHSSIMRLSESSMDKLFDLMTMGVKYQLVCCSYPAELIDITLNHVEAVRALVEDASIEALVDTFIKQFKERYENLPTGEWMELRQTLHRYFQDRRIRVSLFMKESLQTSSGYMVFPKEEEVPPLGEVPGKIRYYVGDEVKSTTSFAYAGAAKPRTRPIRSKLGINLYAKSPSGATSPTPLSPTSSPSPSPSAVHQPTTSPTSATTPTSPPPLTSPTSKEQNYFASISGHGESPSEFDSANVQPTGKIGAAELNLLATLVNPTSSSADKDVVKVNLFGADKWGLYEVDKQGDVIPTTTSVVLDPTRKTVSIEGLMNDMNVGDSEGGEKDLLELLDSTS